MAFHRQTANIAHRLTGQLLARTPILQHHQLGAGGAIDNRNDIGRVAVLGEPSRFVGYVFPVAERSRHSVVSNFETLVLSHGE